MKENYLINVIITQETQGEKEMIESTTVGEYEQKDNKKFIRYKEYSNSDPVTSIESEVKIDQDGVIKIKRIGEITTELILEEGKRHICECHTIAGNMIIGIFANYVTDKLSSDGGYLKAEYEVDFGSGFVNLNKITINIKKNN